MKPVLSEERELQKVHTGTPANASPQNVPLIPEPKARQGPSNICSESMGHVGVKDRGWNFPSSNVPPIFPSQKNISLVMIFPIDYPWILVFTHVIPIFRV